MKVAATPCAALEYVTDDVLRALVPQAVQAGTGPASSAVAVTANHGRWIVECPDCPPGAGAQLACLDDRRFMCHECLNAAVEGLWRPTRWPRSAAKIAGLLDDRAPVEHRNWVPGQTLADLRGEVV